jgi:hypothetical protein
VESASGVLLPSMVDCRQRHSDKGVGLKKYLQRTVSFHADAGRRLTFLAFGNSRIPYMLKFLKDRLAGRSSWKGRKHRSFSNTITLSVAPSCLLHHRTMKISIAVVATAITSASAFSASSFTGKVVKAPTSTSALCMKYKVAVVGGGPAGACAAEIFAQEKGIDTVLFERKLDNAKPCGGAIPLCMVGEFDLPESVVDRKVRTTTRRRPSHRRRWSLPDRCSACVALACSGSKLISGMSLPPCLLRRGGIGERRSGPGRTSITRVLARCSQQLPSDVEVARENWYIFYVPLV